jgi:hypothetical protein
VAKDKVEKGDRSVTSLTDDIATGAIKLPEIQRRYVWKPTQVAKLIESLYRGYPTGSLLMWRATAPPNTLIGNTGDNPGKPVGADPLYLLDGQQRLTALYRVLHDHPDAQVVFNVESEEFQNQSAATSKDPRWVKVYDVVDPDADLFDLADRLEPSVQVEKKEIGQRLQRLAKISGYIYHLEVLNDFPYEEVAQIFVRVNSGGRTLRTTDLALATLSARWPGVVDKLEQESGHWAERGYGNIDMTFLTRALTGAVLGRGLSQWSHARLAAATDEELEQGWKTVQRGLKHLVPLLKNNLKISHSALLPSMIVLLPLIVLLGERADVPLDEDTANGILYWVLVATIRTRYSSATDTKLGQDIPAARSADPVRSLLTNLGIVGTRIEVTPRDLAGRSSTSPYFLLSFLVVQANNAHDWWFGSTIALGTGADQELEYHHIHPQATLKDPALGYSKADINDLANLAFISAKANKKISDRSPSVYFKDLKDTELSAHLIPLDPALRIASAYREFLATRRQLLAEAMTLLLDLYQPSWLVDAAAAETDALAGCELDFTCYESDWDAGQVVATAVRGDSIWSATMNVNDLSSALDAAGEGLDSDVAVAGQSIPVRLDGEDVQVQIGPFQVTGTVDDWRKLVERARADAQPISQLPATDSAPWDGQPLPFPVSSVD